jgi:hypothetical protein
VLINGGQKTPCQKKQAIDAISLLLKSIRARFIQRSKVGGQAKAGTHKKLGFRSFQIALILKHFQSRRGNYYLTTASG